MELWKLDNSTGLPYLLRDIEIGAGDSITWNSYGVQFTVLRNTLFFVAQTTNTGVALLKTNGTSAGTELVFDAYAGPYSGVPHDLYVYKNNLYFVNN